MRPPGRFFVAILWTILAAFVAIPQHSAAETTGFRQAVAEAAARDPVLAEFYKARQYEALWTTAADTDRRAAFFTAIAGAPDHGLPILRYDGRALADAFRVAGSERDRGLLEVRMSRAFLDYAHDLQTGVLTPSDVIPGIKRDVARRDPQSLLASFLEM